MAMTKVSVSVPSSLLTEAKRLCGERGLSAFVTEGIRQQIRNARLQEALEDWQEEFGEFTEEELEEAREELGIE